LPPAGTSTSLESDVDETARHQPVAFEDLMIVLQADFIVGAAFEIIEDDLRQAPLSEDAVVFAKRDLGDILDRIETANKPKAA
jgi:hypothetical protein